MTRTLKEFLEFKIKQKISGKSPVLAWMIQHSAFLLNTFGNGGIRDGLTPILSLAWPQLEDPAPSLRRTH